MWFSEPFDTIAQPTHMKETSARRHVPKPKALPNQGPLRAVPHKKPGDMMNVPPICNGVVAMFQEKIPESRVVITSHGNQVISLGNHSVSVAFSPSAFAFMREQSKELAVIVLHGVSQGNRGPLEDETVTDIAFETPGGVIVTNRKDFRAWLLPKIVKFCRKPVPYSPYFPGSANSMLTVTVVNTCDVPSVWSLTSFAEQILE